MRTTIDLPDDVHRAALQIARDRQQTLSRTVAGLLRAALSGQHGEAAIEVDQESGLPTMRLGVSITAEDVAAADDA